MTKESPRAAAGGSKRDLFTPLVDKALEAGFEELAYAILVIATATTAMMLAPDKPGLEYTMFRWIIVALEFIGVAYVIKEVVFRFFAPRVK